jgi:hypothetical protein
MMTITTDEVFFSCIFLFSLFAFLDLFCRNGLMNMIDGENDPE